LSLLLCAARVFALIFGYLGILALFLRFSAVLSLFEEQVICELPLSACPLRTYNSQLTT
jgi:hypothetical protein